MDQPVIRTYLEMKRPAARCHGRAPEGAHVERLGAVPA